MARIRRNGFSLIELLLVLGLIGIISMIAIPSFMGQRQRARMIGDAKANAQVMAMQLESRRADIGVYGSASKSYTWTSKTGATTAPASFLPSFTPKGNSQMNYTLAIGSTGITYVITVADPSKSGAPTLMTLNQSGSVWTK